MELLATVTWAGVLSWFVEFMKMVIPAGLGLGAGLLVIKYQMKMQNEGKIKSSVHITISEIYNTFIYAFEMFLACYCRYKISIRVVGSRPLSKEPLLIVTSGLSDCLNKNFIKSYIRVCHLRDTQEMILETGSKCIKDFSSSEFTPNYWLNTAQQFARLANFVAYTGAMYIHEMPKHLRLMVNGVDGLKDGLNLQIDKSKHTIIKMVSEATAKHKEEDLKSLFDEAERVMEELEKEIVEGKLFHIINIKS